MSQYLPYSGLKCLNQREIGKLSLNSIREDSSSKYI